MATKLDQIRRLLADGYAFEDVATERATMEAIFRRGPHVVRVRFLPSEAEAILLMGPLRLEPRAP